MQSLEPDAVSANIFLSSGEWGRVLAILQQQVAGSLKGAAVTFNAAGSACEKQDAWAHSLQLVQRMLRCGIDPTNVSGLVVLCAEAAQSWPAAVAGLQMLRDRLMLPTAIHYGELLSAASRRDVWEAAVELFLDMCTDQVPPSDVCLDLVVKACENAGQRNHGLAAIWLSEDTRT